MQYFQVCLNSINQDVYLIFAFSAYTSVFFTFSSKNHVYLVSNVSLWHPGTYSDTIVMLKGENISQYFPPDKFLLGMHNEGKIVGLAEHLVRRTVSEGDIEKVKQVLKDHSKYHFYKLIDGIFDRLIIQ